MERITFDHVDAYNDLYGIVSLHPLVTIVDLTRATKVVNHCVMEYKVYALYLKMTKGCEIQYGRKQYDYQEGTVVSFAPGQVAEVKTAVDEFQPEVYGILFHPDLIRGTSLGQHMNRYSFFSYASSESLHLSANEHQLFVEALERVKELLKDDKDITSKRLIVKHIEILLDHCQRFYERQFGTRIACNRDVLERFEEIMDSYFVEQKQKQFGLPTVQYCADLVHLSPNYFGDLIKRETGKSAQEYIQFKLVEHAKSLLKSNPATISEIAYELGFRYPQHFSRWFKSQTGVTAKAYRKTEI